MDKGLGTCSKVRTRFRLRFRFRHLLKGEDEVALVRIFLGVLDVGQTQVKDLLAVLPFKHLTGVRGLRRTKVRALFYLLYLSGQDKIEDT